MAGHVPGAVARLGWVGCAAQCFAGLAVRGWTGCSVLCWACWAVLCSVVVFSAVLCRLCWLGWMGRTGQGWAGLLGWVGIGMVWSGWLAGRDRSVFGFAWLGLVCLCGVDYAPHAGLPRGGVPSCAIEELEFSAWRDLLTIHVGSLRRKLNWAAHLCIATPEAVEFAGLGWAGMGCLAGLAWTGLADWLAGLGGSWPA